MAYEKHPGPKELRSALAQKKLSPLYLFLGEEEGEKDKLIAGIRQVLFPEGMEPNVGRFHCENDELLQAADFALSGSMFFDKKLCVLYNVDGIKKAGKTKNPLADEMALNIPSGTVLVATSSKNTLPDVFSPEVLKKFSVYQFWRHFDRDIQSYISVELKKTGFSIDRAAAAFLVECTGRDIKKIDEALEILVCTCASPIITRQDIMNFISDESETSIYDFLDMLFTRQAKAIYMYKKLIDGGISDAKIFSAIIRQTGLLEKYHSLINFSASESDVLDKCGVFKKNRDSFLQMTRLFPPEKIGTIYAGIRNADERRKSISYGSGLLTNPVFGLVTDVLFK